MDNGIVRGLTDIALAIKAKALAFLATWVIGGDITPTTAADYVLATADLSGFPAGASIFLATTIQWRKTDGVPASSFKLMYNGSIISAITTTYSYTASIYDGRTVIGAITKVAGVNSATAVLHIDGSATGAHANANIVAFRIG